jgi:MoxR-like ATPase
MTGSQRRRTAAAHVPDQVGAPDHRDGRAYSMTPELDLAVQVALATNRPLLLRGEPGSGKSSLAAFIARRRHWRYYEHVVTSRTEATDLLWTFDAVRKLADAQVSRAADLDDHAYVRPGVLWWALAPKSARSRGRDNAAAPGAPLATDPALPIHGERSPLPDHAGILIDEIDKSEPDVPNNLLVPLGSHQFMVDHIDTMIAKEPPVTSQSTALSRHLVVITTNEERDLPQAFLRRCVVAWLPRPDSDRLVTIARMHLDVYEGGCTAADLRLAAAVAKELERTWQDADRRGIRGPSTAEYLDAVRTCRSLGVGVDDPEWAGIRDLVLVKSRSHRP